MTAGNAPVPRHSIDAVNTATRKMSSGTRLLMERRDVILEPLFLHTRPLYILLFNPSPLPPATALWFLHGGTGGRITAITLRAASSLAGDVCIGQHEQRPGVQDGQGQDSPWCRFCCQLINHAPNFSCGTKTTRCLPGRAGGQVIALPSKTEIVSNMHHKTCYTPITLSV